MSKKIGSMLLAAVLVLVLFSGCEVIAQEEQLPEETIEELETAINHKRGNL